MLQSDARLFCNGLRGECEAQGVQVTKERLALGMYGNRKRAVVEEWVYEMEAREDALRDAKEREIDRSISRQSNRITFWIGVSGNAIGLLALAVATYAALH